MRGFLMFFCVMCLALVMAIPCNAGTVKTTTKVGPFGRVRSQTTVSGGGHLAPVQGLQLRAVPVRSPQAFILSDGTVIFR